MVNVIIRVGYNILLAAFALINIAIVLIIHSMSRKDCDEADDIDEL